MVHEKVLRDGVVPALQAAEQRVTALEAVIGRDFWGRLRWLLTGR
jgi:hypothetical protein